MPEATRDHLFISHARPEDDEFTLWLALQLAKRGYAVWCDLTKLLGGENFYRDIEHTIRYGTAKFLYVLTKTSNVKEGVRQELHIADDTRRNEQLGDFIIPLHLDDLPRREMNIQVAQLNSIPFDKSWSEGLVTLLRKLEQEEVPKHPNFSPKAVAQWWQARHQADQGVVREPEECFSNLFPVRELPPRIYLHAPGPNELSKEVPVANLPYPAILHAPYLVTFAPREDFDGWIGPPPIIDDSHSFDTINFLEGSGARNIVDDKQRRDLIFQLLRRAWELLLQSRELPTHPLANNARCFYFKKDVVHDDMVKFQGVLGKMVSRGVVGYKTIRDRQANETKRFWHFGIQAKPYIELTSSTFAYYVKPHVLFSDDGQVLWDNDKRMHVARRGQCKQWWNADWRDRILASMTWLANSDGDIEIPMSKEFSMRVNSRPVALTSPVSNLGVDTEPVDELEMQVDDDEEDEDEL